MQLDGTLDFEFDFDDFALLPRDNSGNVGEVQLNTPLVSGLELGFPLLSAAMPGITGIDLARAMGQFGGLGVLHRGLTAEQQCAAVQQLRKEPVDRSVFSQATQSKNHDGLILAASCDPTDTERAGSLVAAGVDVLFLDTPNPTSAEVYGHFSKLRRSYPETSLVIGSVITSEGAQRYIDGGVDAIKVGLGSGKFCSFRNTTGLGALQGSAVLAVAKVARPAGIPVISDGGIRGSGDLVKCLALGASSAMVGGLVAGCTESEAPVIQKDQKPYKQVKGLHLAMLELPEGPTGYPSVDAYLAKNSSPRNEGSDGLVPLTGPCHLTLLKLKLGLRVGVMMAGAKSIEELPTCARFQWSRSAYATS